MNGPNDPNDPNDSFVRWRNPPQLIEEVEDEDDLVLFRRCVRRKRRDGELFAICVEMRALAAVAVAALTIYDMVKAMVIGDICLVEKRGVGLPLRQEQGVLQGGALTPGAPGILADDTGEIGFML